MQFVEAHVLVAELADDKRDSFVTDKLNDIADGTAAINAVHRFDFKKSSFPVQVVIGHKSSVI